jgi:hypothetical protein
MDIASKLIDIFCAFGGHQCLYFSFNTVLSVTKNLKIKTLKSYYLQLKIGVLY